MAKITQKSKVGGKAGKGKIVKISPFDCALYHPWNLRFDFSKIVLILL